ncbi:MAG: hypothetical protein Q8R83_06145 [Legionellaceae bacterium]|nr:hypothetical protein [Legionellaceae bacterium]
MNELTENMQLAYQPELAIVVYKRKEYSDYYLESRPIVAGQMGAGAPLQEKTLQGIIKAMESKNDDKPKEIGGVVPSNLLYFKNINGNLEMFWYRKAEKRPMYFVEHLNIPDGVAMVPPLLYITKGNGLTIFALRENKRPDEKSELFQPPFHNCSGLGSVCLGSAKVKYPASVTYQNLMEYYEKLFWGSAFTHNGAASATGNLNLIWKDQITNPKKPFDLSLLIKASKTYKDLLR